MKTLIMTLVAFSTLLLTAGCAEEENKDTPVAESRYSMTSITCNGTAATTTGIVYTITLSGATPTLFGLAGITGTTAACSGVYAYTTATMNADGTFTLVRPEAALSCTNLAGEAVTSCNQNGIACTTSSTDPAISISGTYTRSATEFVLTYTSTGNSMCTTGQTEVVTLAVSQ